MEVTMPLVVRAFPVLPGREDNVRALASDIAGPRREEACDFYRRFGVTHESWHLQQTPHGPWVIAVTELTDEPEKTAQAYAGSVHEYDRWFKEQVLQLSGIDPEREPLGPPTETLLDWEE
jgi:hypothetical protein